MLSLTDVNFAYEKQKTLDKINLKIKNGRLTGLIGPNGSGKTTLLKILSGVLKPAEGRVGLNGGSISELSQREVARTIAVVPQETNVNFDFTVWEFTLMGRTPYLRRLENEGNADYNLAREVLKKTGTWDLRNRFITTLSGGERQKVIIAKALAQTPKILLLDEPTANLDIKNQIEIMKLLHERVGEQGITAIMAIHDINLAARYCDEIVLLKKGRIFDSGSPENVLNEENIKSVFEVEARVSENPEGGSVYIIPK